MEQKLQNPLLIFCFDSVVVCDKTTFLSYIFGKLNIAYWHEEAEGEKQRIDGMFAILFNEVLKRRQDKINLANKKHE